MKSTLPARYDWAGVLQKLCAVSNMAVQVMTKIGAICLVTIGTWVVIKMAVQFGAYRHTCAMGTGSFPGSSR